MTTAKCSKSYISIFVLLLMHAVPGAAQMLKSPGVSYSAGGYETLSVTVADVNRDGIPDLVVANLCASYATCANGGTVGVLLGNGDGTFKPAVTYGSGGYGAYTVTVADVNGDGKLDLLVGNAFAISFGGGDGTVGVLLGNGDGTFQPAATYDSGGGGAYSIAVADVNADGKLDLVVANHLCVEGLGIPCTGDAVVGVLLGNGDGTFKPAALYSSGGIAGQSLRVADVNGDGKPDVIVVNSCATNFCLNGEVSVLLADGKGTFQPAVPYDSGGYEATAVTVADVNGDGKPDLLVTSGCAVNINCGFTALGVVGVLLGNGDGTFQPAVVYDSGGLGATSVAVTDINGDGKLDLIVANGCSTTCASAGTTVGVLLGNGDGTFLPAVSYRSGGTNGASSTLAVADLNGDGLPDVVVSKTCATGNNCKTNGVVDVLIGTAQKTTTRLATSGSPSFVGQTVTFTATLSPQYGAIPDGAIATFSDGATVLASVPLAGGTATYATSSLAAKAHTIKASYAGDLNFKSSFSSLAQVVNKYATTTALISSPNPSQSGQFVTFSVSVTSAGPAPTGKVKFLDGATGIGLATVSRGVATLTKSTLAVGTHSITAEYVGDAASAASTSSVLSQVVQ